MTAIHHKRCKRFDLEGEAHCLTFSCFQRLPLLGRPRSCRWMLEAFESARGRGLFDLWAYVIMPEHVHVILMPHQDVKVSAILTALKQAVSNRALAWLRRHRPDFLPRLEDIQPNGKRHHRFWQRGGGYDRNLRSIPDIFEKIDYVHHNPVRRGLVENPADWPWSSCRAWETGVDEPIPIDRGSLPMLTPIDKKKYR
ncbi:MAG: transposase [Pirellulales bacterium]|nr:transposase [Pirellulales bacterium]